MLNLMRENAGSWIIKIILGVIVLVFVFLGIGPKGNKNMKGAAVVNDKVIPMEAYRKAYNNIVDNYRRQFGNQFNDEMIKMLGIKDNALNALIENELVGQEAEKLGISVAKEELQRYIQNLPYFQTKGKFDFSRYDRLIKSSGQTKAYFEYQIQKEMITDKMKKLVTASSNVTDNEVHQRFLWKNAEIKVEYALIDPAKYKDLKVTDDEIKAYYDENKTKYTVSRQVQVDYLKFSPKAYRSSVKVTDAEIKERYETDPEKYSIPAKVKASHILIKVDSKAKKEDIEKARKKAMDIYKKASGGEDFAELAKKYSEGPSASSGGDLGTFERGQMVKPFSDKAFSMKKGEISEPVKTIFGWHIINVTDKTEASTKTLKQATPEIKAQLITEKSENMAFENSDICFDDIVNGSELNDAAKNIGVKVLSTKLFKRVPGPSEIPAKFRKDFAEAAFNLEAKGFSDVLDFSGDYYILQVESIKKPYVPELKDIQEKVTADALNQAKDEKASGEAETLLSEVKKTKGFKKGQGVETIFFKRNNNGTDLKIDREVIAEAFKLSKDESIVPQPVKGTKGYYVISLKEKKKADESQFLNEKEELKKELLSEKKSMDYKTWLNSLKVKSKITKNVNLL